MNYKVTINSLHTKTLEDKTDFVSLVDFEYSTTVEDITVSTISVVSFAAPTDEYTPFADLTKDQVTGWVEASPDIELLRTTLQCKLDALSQPSIGSSTSSVKNAPPWNTNQVEEAA